MVASLLAFLLAYVFSTFFKVSTNIVIPIFQQQFTMTAAVAGFVSSAYFLSYCIMQLLTGPLCRKYGQHKVVGIGYLIATIGSLLFGYAHNSAMVLIGRILIGIGVGPVYIATIAFMTDNFEGRIYAIMIGLVMAAGGFGSAVSSAPLQAIIARFGVISTFVGISAITGILALLILVLGKSYRPRLATSDMERTGILKTLSKGLKAIVESPSLILIAIGWSLLCAFQHSYQGMWSASWFTASHPDLDNLSGYSSTIVSIGIIVGTLASERLHRRELARNISTIQGEWMLSLSCMLVCAVHGLGMVGAGLSIALLFVCDFGFGLAAGNSTVQKTAFARTLADAGSNATVIGVMNAIGSIAVMFYQWLSGAAFDALSTTHSANVSFLVPYTILAAVITITTAIANYTFRKNG